MSRPDICHTCGRNKPPEPLGDRVLDWCWRVVFLVFGLGLAAAILFGVWSVVLRPAECLIWR